MLVLLSSTGPGVIDKKEGRKGKLKERIHRMEMQQIGVTDRSYVNSYNR